MPDKATAEKNSAISVTSQPVSDASKVNTRKLVRQIKRIIMVTADKGGTGKSTFARILAHVLIKRQIKTLAYDADLRNSQLCRHYDGAFPDGVRTVNLSMGEDINALLDSLAEDYPVILLDLPAGIGELIELLETRLTLSQVAKENGYRLTFATVLNRGLDCINSLRSLIDAFGDEADHVVVKNLHFGSAEKFKRFDSSKTKNTLEAMGTQVITMPDLDDDVVDKLDEKSLTYADALRPGAASISTRAWVNSFLSDAEPGIIQAADYLGLGDENGAG